MRRIVLDASALAAIAFREPDYESLIEKLEDAIVHAPALLTFELANVAWKRSGVSPTEKTILLALGAAPRATVDSSGIREPVDVVRVPQALGCSTYDAACVWLAERSARISSRSTSGWRD